MKTRSSVRRLAGAVAVVATAAIAVNGFASPADAATGATATLRSRAATLTVRGTAGVDHIAVSGSGANITVAGLSPLVTPVSLGADDFLQIQTLDGNDIVDSSGLQRGLVRLIVQ